MKSRSQKAYEIGKVEDYIRKAEKLLDALDINPDGVADALLLVRAHCDTQIARLRDE